MVMAPVGIGTLTSPRTRSSPTTGFSIARSGLASIRLGPSTADFMAVGITAAATGITMVAAVAASHRRGARFAVAPTGALSEAAVFVVVALAAVFMVVVLEAEADSTAGAEADIVKRVVI